MVVSLYITLGAALGALVGPLLARGARWLVKRTRTERDDQVLAALEKALRDHPEVVEAIVRELKDGAL